MARTLLFSTDELQPGEVRPVLLENVAIVVVRKRDGEYRALRDRCMHQGARLSSGHFEPQVVSSAPGSYELSPDRDVLRCGWHSYEYDVDNGRSPADPQNVRVRAYSIVVEEGMVYVDR